MATYWTSPSASPATTATLCQAAWDGGIHVVIGVNERNTEASGGSLFNTLIYRRVRHRLQMPQHKEVIT
ncbi:hypothetical protein [Sulfuricella sp.]|uniref:hypothetical protein n=1 Tax=Sulfuricella sp. TaxID=2099377 RepID=UPI002C5760DB|nr:hypothetical protein [Sulfuricella sp.]HUX63298.1 hypothetical protein [Sulfuricella sp.]